MQTSQPRPSGEEQLAKLAMAGADFLAGLRQPLVIDAEKGLERISVQAAQEPRQALVGYDRRVIEPRSVF